MTSCSHCTCPTNDRVNLAVNVPPAVRKEAKRLALDHGITLRELVIDAIAAWKSARGIV